MRFALILLLGTVSGCTTTVVLGSDEDARARTDSGPHVTCGARDCDPGLVCCNTTCGTCGADGTCPRIPTFCPDAGFGCPADLVVLSGSPVCASYVWNGADCVQTFGCTCTGTCALARPTYADCMSVHASCWPAACDSSHFCPSGFFCERSSCTTAQGSCVRVPDDCSSTTPAPTCGCDGAVYRSTCDAQRATQTTAAPTCGACDMPAITIAPGCATSLGWAWDGAQCVEQIGCSCTGDCDRMEATQVACTARYEPSCAAYFPCSSASCARGTQYCADGSCLSFGSSCSPATCTCLMLSSRQTCTDDGHGGIVVTSS